MFCLQFVNMATIDIPQGGSMARYLERKDVQSAYQVACLGVTEADWKSLAQAALQVGLGCVYTQAARTVTLQPVRLTRGATCRHVARLVHARLPAATAC